MRTYCWWIRGAQFAELAKLSIASVKKIDRFSAERNLLIYTDDEAPDWADGLTGHGTGIGLRRMKPGRPAMVANLDAQVDALVHSSRGDQVLFLDADTLLRREFPWAPDIDLYATWRDHVNGDRDAAKFQPWNYGVVGAVSNAATIEAFFWLRARILQMAPDRQAWYGNQLALADLLGAYRTEPWTARIRWTLADEGTALRVQPLPCNVWNYSPDSADEDVSGKAILHMKGGRKDLMQHYAEAA